MSYGSCGWPRGAQKFDRSGSILIRSECKKVFFSRNMTLKFEHVLVIWYLLLYRSVQWCDNLKCRSTTFRQLDPKTSNNFGPPLPVLKYSFSTFVAEMPSKVMWTFCTVCAGSSVMQIANLFNFQVARQQDFFMVKTSPSLISRNFSLAQKHLKNIRDTIKLGSAYSVLKRIENRYALRKTYAREHVQKSNLKFSDHTLL